VPVYTMYVINVVIIECEVMYEYEKK